MQSTRAADGARIFQESFQSFYLYKIDVDSRFGKRTNTNTTYPFTSDVTQSLLGSYGEGLLLQDSTPVPIAQCLLHPHLYGGIVRLAFQDIVGADFMGRRLFAKGSRLFAKGSRLFTKRR